MRPDDKMSIDWPPFLTAGLLVALLAIWGCDANAMGVITTAQQQCVTAKRLQCGAAGYIDPSPKYPCGECGGIGTTPTVTPTAATPPQTAIPIVTPPLAPVAGPSWRLPKTEWSRWRTTGSATWRVTGYGDITIPTMRWFAIIHGIDAAGNQTNVHAGIVIDPPTAMRLEHHFWNKAKPKGKSLKAVKAQHGFRFDPTVTYTMTLVWTPTLATLTVSGGGAEWRDAVGWTAPAKLSKQGLAVGSGIVNGAVGKTPKVVMTKLVFAD